MNYQETRNSYLNCEKRIFDGAGPFGIPEILPEELDFNNTAMTGVNYAKGERHPEDKILHFYLDDYQFDRFWNCPSTYLPILSKFKAVLSPDFSLYTDFPKAVQIFNYYRKHWLARYWQENGIKVIPTICWSDEESFGWCFDGEPRNSTISISVLGCNKNEQMKHDFWVGFNKAIETLTPKKILLFKGNSLVQLPDCGGAEIIEVKSGNLAGAKAWTDSLKVKHEVV